ncbi:hypothetical protein SCHPADRAFT_905653 [Schizopora paradoxa]|uniref:Uncharacterized protein n=1 Tax=Schizopora paradoxa TaxID=27342 RepID=A0A0H2S4K9_9AGAM|nr:hypothetical protein SCHPADRAFT_905653 [Schizopora paradoxa]
MTEEKRRREKQDDKSINTTREQQYSNRAMISVFLVGASVSLLAYMRNIISARPDDAPQKVTDSVVNCLWFLSAIIAGTSVFAASSGQYLLVSGVIDSDVADGTRSADSPRPKLNRMQSKYPVKVASVLNNAVFGAVEDMTRILPMISVVLLTSGILVLCWAEMPIEVAIILTFSLILLAVTWHLIIFIKLRRDENYAECAEHFTPRAMMSRLRNQAKSDEVLPR